MFKFLNEKLKETVEKFSTSKDLEETEEEIIKEEKTKKTLKKEEIQEKKSIIEKVKEKLKKTEKSEEEKSEGKKNIIKRIKEKITKVSLSEDKFEELFWDLELELLEFNVALEVIELIKESLKKELVENKVERRNIEEIIRKILLETIEGLFEKIKPLEQLAKEKPFKILFLGVNGSGKTTTCAKIAKYLKDKKLSSVIAASDTFRAAAIQQLEEHANNLKIKIVKHDYGADAAAVAFDAIKHAKASRKDFVLIDTAGRSHVNNNLMDELAKIVRISKPNLKILVVDALTGNDAVDQAKQFNEKIGVDAIILTKVDADEKGGAVISISHAIKKPILFLGIGQEYKDIEPFSTKKFMKLLS